MRISDWSSDVCSSDLRTGFVLRGFECRTVQRVECSFRICGLQAGRGSMQHQPVLYRRYRRSAVLLARMPFDPANKILAHRRGARASQIGAKVAIDRSTRREIVGKGPGEIPGAGAVFEAGAVPLIECRPRVIGQALSLDAAGRGGEITETDFFKVGRAN